MEVQCIFRGEGLWIRYRDVVKSRSTAELAQVATLESKARDHILEEQNVHFYLSPIQRFYFDQPSLPTQIHSSVHLHFLEDMDTSSVALAIEGVVGRHSQLRTRFRNTAEGWQQSIVKDVLLYLLTHSNRAR